MKTQLKENEIVFLGDNFLSDIMNILEMISGRKTYFLALLGVIYAVAGYFTGHLGNKEAIEVIWASLTVFSVRHAISKV